MSLTHLLATGLRRTPDKVALVASAANGATATSTYAELFARSRDLARALAERGLERGDRVAFYLGNRIELVVAHLAVLELGGVILPMNLAYRRRELTHILTDAEPRLLIAEQEQLSILDDLEPRDRSSVEGILLAEELAGLAAPSSRRPSSRAARDDDPALLMYTSGTTGRSKGALLSHRNLAATVRGLLQAWEWRGDDVLLLALPLFHVHGLVVGLHSALASGATVRLHRRFDARTVVDEIAAPAAADRPTLFFGVPAMYQRLSAEITSRAGACDLSSMRLFCSGSAPLDPGTFEAFERSTGHAILERYGMTETGMLLSNPYRGERRPGTVGTPLPGVSARIVDAEGEPVADGVEGELEVRGENVFSGYWRDPDQSAASFRGDARGDRWFRTGDLAVRDRGTGCYTLLGRRHDMILSGGLNIYPREIEEVLTAHPSVREAAVVGRPDPDWGETPVAFLVLDAALDEDALIAHCRAQMAAFKLPRRFEVLDELPKNALGKVQKHRLPGSSGRRGGADGAPGSGDAVR